VAVVERMTEWLAPLGVDVTELPLTLYEQFDPRDFNKTHVSFSTIGRFFILQSVRQAYDKILYLDGDIWPVGDIAALLQVDIPDGFIAAAEDRSYYWRGEASEAGRAVRSYYKQLGINGDLGYFNAGVLLARSDTWREVSAEAFAFFKNNVSRCLYHDQSALNVVTGRRRLRLNPKWNYLYDYVDWHIRPLEAPGIIHFCGPRKPWKLHDHPYFNNYEPARRALHDIGLSSLCPLENIRVPHASFRVGLKHAVMSRFRNIRRRREFLRVARSSRIG
jgi:lipopolysaccharide biosynthesis glycosyltransferase